MVRGWGAAELLDDAVQGEAACRIAPGRARRQQAGWRRPCRVTSLEARLSA